MTRPVLFSVVDAHGAARILALKGRDAWALTELIRAGDLGCTPIDTPGPRWSGYVHKLRHRYGLDIATVTEPHGGPYKGSHARYILRSVVHPLSADIGAARRTTMPAACGADGP
jgi:hypothetical protein